MFGGSNSEPPSTDSNRYDGEIEDTGFLEAQPTRKKMKTCGSTKKRARADRKGFAFSAPKGRVIHFALYTRRKGSVNRNTDRQLIISIVAFSKPRLDKSQFSQT
jgi:hypothetical protein